MGNDATIQVRIDAKTKTKAEKIFKRCGMTISDAVRIFINQAVEEKGIPFTPRIPNAESLEALAESLADECEEITLNDLQKQWDEVNKKPSKQRGQKILNNEYSVKLHWDKESSIWIATSDDIPGLILGSGSVDVLMERVRFATPEIMELNNIDGDNCTLHFHFDRYEKVCL